MMRFLIADPLAVARRGLKQLLQDEYPEAAIEEMCNPADLLQKAMQAPWDLIISDIAMPGHYGLELLSATRRKFPRLPVLILSAYPEHQYARRILQTGVSGYLNKMAQPDELLAAVHNVLNGKKYMASHLTEKMIQDLLLDKCRPLHETLSNREFDVFKLLACGRKTTDIAQTLSLSITMIGNYRARIFQKMNLKNNAELILYATRHKLG